MKWVFSILLAAILTTGILFVYLHRQELGLAGSRPAPPTEESAAATPEPAQPAAIVWETVDRPGDGFKVEMPAGVQQTQVPAYDEHGGLEQVRMIFSNPNAATTFSVAWADNPPVARVNQGSAERTLEMARDDALNRTQTALVNESGASFGGFPARDFSAQNENGGAMNSRLILAGHRLYMLTAAFPSAAARRDADVERFFNSMTIGSQPHSARAAEDN